MAEKTTLGELIDYMRKSCRTIHLNDDEFRFDSEARLEYAEAPGQVRHLRMTAEAIKGVCSAFKAPGAWVSKQTPSLAGYILDELVTGWGGDDIEMAFELVMDDDGVTESVSNAYDTSKRFGIVETLVDISNVIPKNRVVIQPDVSSSHVSFYTYDPGRDEEYFDSDQHYMIGTHISYSLDKGKSVCVNTALINTLDETAIDLSFDGTGRIGFDTTKGRSVSDIVSDRMANEDSDMSRLYETKGNIIEDVEHMLSTYASQCGVGKRLLERVSVGLAGASDLTAIELADSIAREEMGVKSDSDVEKIALLAGCAFMAHDPRLCPKCHREIDDSIVDDRIDAGII